jgi:cell pole-organizing protein PopZ
MTSQTAPSRPHSLSEDRQTNEPSMEEILASIRRLIAEDEAELGAAALSEARRPLPGRVAKTWTPPTATEALGRMRAPAEQNFSTPGEAEFRSPSSLVEAEVTDSLAPHALSREAAEAQEPAGGQERGENDAEPETLAEPMMAEELMAHDEAFLVEELEEAAGFDEAEASGFAPALVSSDAAASITAQFQSLAASRVLNDTGLLHEYAREMLRPMLRAWLDDNLPTLVERLVRAEIERVARGGRR